MFGKKKAQINELLNRVEKLEERAKLVLHENQVPPHLRKGNYYHIELENKWYKVDKVVYLEWEVTMLKEYLGIRWKCEQPEPPKCKIVQTVKNETEE